MQTNVRRFFEERNIIQANPMLASFRRIRLVLIILILMLLMGILLLALYVKFAGGSKALFDVTYNVVWLLLVGAVPTLVVLIWQERFWRRVERRRQRAAQGDQTLLAKEQPGVDQKALSLPFTIGTRTSRKYLFAVMGFLGLLAVLAIVLYIFSDNSTQSSLDHFLYSLLPFMAIAVVVIGVLFAVVLFWRGRQEIEVTESGLVTRFGGRVSKMDWNEAHLFAVYGVSGARNSGLASTYELSSANKIVRWIWVQRENYNLHLAPAVSRDEYNRQMEGLVSLVAAKTGLPLYDLR
ncbi:MAG TPA: hypothetical protein VF043_03190 [Ktedonobacteraceae bacterium]